MKSINCASIFFWFLSLPIVPSGVTSEYQKGNATRNKTLATRCRSASVLVIILERCHLKQ